MGSDKGGSADQSGMMQAMASAEAATKMYDLGMKQLDWTKEVWTQEQPLIDKSQQAQIDYSTQLSKSLQQMQAETQAQWEEYNDVYKPLEEKFAGEAANWDSPDAIAQARGEAMADVGEQGMAGLNTAAETLRAYGVNPGAPRYASLYTSAQPMIGAAEAAAGTTAAQNLRLQKMGLESGAINTGRGMVNTTGSLTQAGTGAGSAGIQGASGAGSTAFGNVNATGVGAGAASQLFNAGTGAMNSYVNAVDGYNSAQADFAKANASGMSGFGSAFGTIAGALIGKIAKGGPVQRYADGGPTDPQYTPDQGGGATGIPSQPLPPAQSLPMGQEVQPTPDGTTGGAVLSYMSPSGGQQTDDVHALLNKGEYVVDKAAAEWIGQKQLAKLVDTARRERAQFDQRQDVGGEPTGAIPQQPTFVSRPAHMATTRGAIPGMPA